MGDAGSVGDSSPAAQNDTAESGGGTGRLEGAVAATRRCPTHRKVRDEWGTQSSGELEWFAKR